MENSWVFSFLLLALFSRCLTFLTIQLCQDFLILLSPDLLCNTVTVRDTISKMLDLNQVAIHIICTYFTGSERQATIPNSSCCQVMLLTYYKTQLLHGRYRFLKDCFDSDCRLDPHPIGVLGPVLSRIVKKHSIPNIFSFWEMFEYQILNIFGFWEMLKY